MPPIESLTMPKPAVAPSCLLARSDPKSPSLPSRPQKVPEMLQSGARAARALCVETNKKWRLLVVVQWPGNNSVDPGDRGFCSVHLDSQIGCLLLLQALVLQLAGDVLEAHPQPSLYLPLLPLLLPLLHLLTQVQGLSGLFTALPRLDISPGPCYSFTLPPLLSCPQAGISFGQECGVGGTGLCWPVSPGTADRVRPRQDGGGRSLKQPSAGFTDQTTLRQVDFSSCSKLTASRGCSSGAEEAKK